MATDQELNEYVSVKKYAPYRQDKGDRYRWNKKDQEKLHELKSIVKNRSGGIRTMAGGQAPSDSGEKVKKRKGKKERMKAKMLETPMDDNRPISAGELDTMSLRKRKREGDKDIVHAEEPERQKKKKKGKHRENNGDQEPN